MTDNIATQTIVTAATYGQANETLSIAGGTYFGAWAGETRTYNSLKQLTALASGALSINYTFPSTYNNGKISSQTDTVSGETVTYTYDALNRLATAENQSTFSPSWGQQFTYDGFGNLTNTAVIQGSAPSMTASYDYNNHAGGEDANGNPGYVPDPAFGSSGPAIWDVENRLLMLWQSTPVMSYAYDPANKRVWRGTWTGSYGSYTRGGTDEITFWSITGQKLATYNVTTSGSTIYATQSGTNYYFGAKLIKNNNGWVYADGLGSIGKFYPYGIERSSSIPPNGTEKFTGYFRDSETGNDYADQRYISPGYGRFVTPDAYMANNGGSGDPTDPGSWNRYAYTEGDPINFIDPEGEVRYCPWGQTNNQCNNPPATGGTVVGPLTLPRPVVPLRGRSNPTLPPLLGAGPGPAPPPPSCEQLEEDYVFGYLSYYGSPLASYATQIVQQSDAAGIDDRFIVALAGVETTYATHVTASTWGAYNAFSNANHCAALSPTSQCQQVNPYQNFAAAISDVIQLLTSPLYVNNTGSVGDQTSVFNIYNLYETGNPNSPAPALGTLDTIYQNQLGGNLLNVMFSRCP